MIYSLGGKYRTPPPERHRRARIFAPAQKEYRSLKTVRAAIDKLLA
jgi:hypothetical protein